ncbi:MAG TPA: type II toxin-antitoxin system VapC family toxin [Acidimicrobiales bacterium]|nr:type II toxin-antitoxin system VapC family toxin [Acidimicrobiales bacterium]
MTLIDTSVAVTLAVADHESHGATMDAVGGRTIGLAGHAWFETFSVLTRLPPPARRRPSEVARLLAHNFPQSRFLDVKGQQGVTTRLAELGIAGGSVYDALIGAAARHHGLPLLTRDRRAVDTYRTMGVDFEVLP